jgi:PKD repeat protein
LNGSVGQTLTFSAAPAATTSGCGTIQTYSTDFGDGSAPSTAQPATHSYTAPGPYQLTLTVTDCAGVTAMATGSITIAAGGGGSSASGASLSTGSGSGASSSSSTSSGASSSGSSSPPSSPSSSSGSPAASSAAPSIGYLTGWNLISGPQGTTVTNNSGSLYTFQGGDTQYETLAPGASLQVGQGYWAYFASASTATLPAAGPQTYSVFLPAGQYVMIGNPGSTPAAVTGADSVFVFDPVGNSYVPASALAPGQGAWAISAGGGAVTVAGH